MQRIAKLVLLVSTMTLAACGGRAFEVNGGDAGPGNDAGNNGDGGASPFCPATAPAEGASCAPAGAVCEYGNDPNQSCNLLATCNGGAWSRSDFGGKPPPGNCPTIDHGVGAGCPSDFASVPRSAVCTPSGLECDYTEGRCRCQPRFGGPQPQDAGGPVSYWSCDVPTTTGCPYPRPRIGSACSQPGLDCDYGTCSFFNGANLVCTDGAWQDAPVGCPAG